MTGSAGNSEFYFPSGKQNSPLTLGQSVSACCRKKKHSWLLYATEINQM